MEMPVRPPPELRHAKKYDGGAEGARSVHIWTTGAEKQRCTVMLAVTADGCKLPPYVIFKKKTLPKGPFPEGIRIHVQEKGRMSADLMAGLD